MGVTWTKEQQKVIDLRDRNILVSAAAGSGKTAVLVERIITMLTADKNPVDVDQLLIVTFTEAAAAEMKERIRAAIEKKLSEDPENEHLKQQETLIHNAQITTIHSFCLSVIRDHFHAIDIDPGFRIGEEGELKLLRHDVLEEVLEERYAGASQRFLDFSSAYGGGRSDKKLEELILKIYEYSRSYPDAAGWLRECVEAYRVTNEEELEDSIYVRCILENVTRYLTDVRELLRQGLTICREADGPAAYESTLLLDQQMVERICEADTFAALVDVMQKVSWSRLAANRDKSVSEEKAASVKTIREEVKGLIDDVASQYFYQDMEGILEDMARCLPAMEELAELVQAFADKFEEKKRNQNMIDFSDMEQYALRILTKKTDDGFAPSDVAGEYRQQFREIMIDEYQDSNLIQETILTSISTVSEGRYNIFMVGDVKQSIYRFRLSRPELFMEKFDAYDTEDGKRQRIDLHKNFRSRREVLDSCNYIFRQIMTRELGGITYDDKSALYVGADYKEGKDLETEVLVIDSGMEGYEALTDGEAVSERELEARAIAGKIRMLLEKQQVIDKKSGEFRPVRYSDIVILTRSVKGFADIFTEVLNRQGIPTYAGTREGYFAAQEIGVLLDYLRVLDNRQQDIPLAAVLLSQFGELTKEEIAVIRSSFRDVAFYQAVAIYQKEGDEIRIRSKLEKCLGLMDAFREIVPYTPIHELLLRILSDTGYGDFVAAMPGGAQRSANIEMLVSKARTFEAASYKGLFHFVRYIEQLKKYDVDYGEASIEDEQSDTVRVMTIHKSKGLEFPIVFVAGMGKRFNMQDARSSVVLHARLGVGLDAVDLKNRTKSPSIIKKVIQKEETLDSLGEELRVLYVALTRAKEKLIITGTCSNLDKRLSYYEMVRAQKRETLTFGRLSKASTYWDWILPALMRLTSEIPIRLEHLTVEDIVGEEVAQETAGKLARIALEQWDTEKTYNVEVKEAIEEQFNYHYPHGSGRTQKLKFTVSELKKRVYLMENSDESEALGEVLYEEPEVVPLIPDFLKEEEELTGASRGTAYHRLMELLDFSRDYDEKKLTEAMVRYQKEGKLTQEMAECIRPGDIMRFLESNAGKRMAACAKVGNLMKEQPFVLGVDAREIYPDEQEGEFILVQGIIDVCFEEPDGLVVLDYKTDKIYCAEELVEKYHAQLDYYAKALEQMTQKKVKEKILYSFTLGEAIRSGR